MILTTLIRTASTLGAGLAQAAALGEAADPPVPRRGSRLKFRVSKCLPLERQQDEARKDHIVPAEGASQKQS